MSHYLDKLYHWMNFDINHTADDALYQDFFTVLRISCTFPNFSRKFFLRSILYMMFYIAIIAFDSYCLLLTLLKLFDSSFILFIQSLHFFLLELLAVIMLVDFNKKRKVLNHFFELVGKGFYDYSEKHSEEFKNKLKLKMKKERRRLLVLPILAICAGISLVILPSLLDDNHLTTEGINFDLLVPAHFPFNTRHGFKYYIACMMEVCLIIIIVVTVGSGAFVMIVMEQHLYVQLSILLKSVNSIEDRAVNRYVELYHGHPKSELEMYDDRQFQLSFQFCLEQNIKHHQILLGAARDLNRVISIPVFIIFILGMVVIALSLFVITKEKQLIGTLLCSVALCLVEIVSIFLLTFFGQRLIDQSSQLRHDVYSIKWYLCSMPIRRDVMILQVASLTPITLKAGGIIQMNMDTFASVLNSAYSYFNMVNVFEKV